MAALADQLELSSWARAYLRLGEYLAGVARPDTPLAGILVVPFREYCSVFTSMGFLHARLADRVQEIAVAERLELLRDLPSGSLVIARKRGRNVRGRLRHLQDAIIVDSPGGRYIFRGKKVLQVSPVSGPRKARGVGIRKSSANVDLLSRLMDGAHLDLFLSKASYEVAIIGVKSRIEQELATKLPLTMDGAGAWAPRDLLPLGEETEALVSYGEIVPDTAETPPTARVARISVMDGSRAVNRWFWATTSDVRLCVLSRRDPQFDEAVGHILDASLSGATFEPRCDKLLPLPATVEFSAFWL